MATVVFPCDVYFSFEHSLILYNEKFGIDVVRLVDIDDFQVHYTIVHYTIQIMLTIPMMFRM